MNLNATKCAQVARFVVASDKFSERQGAYIFRLLPLRRKYREIHSTLERRSNRVVYEGEAMVDQPLKDWVRKKDLYFSDGWPNSNENLQVNDGESAWLRSHSPARVVPVDSGITETIPSLSSLARDAEWRVRAR